MPLEEQTRHTADAVAAHPGLGAVGVEYAHTAVTVIIKLKNQKSVCAYAESPTAHAAGKCSEIADGRVKPGIGQTVDDDEIVADAVHLYERNAFHLSDSTALTMASIPSMSTPCDTPMLMRTNLGKILLEITGAANQILIRIKDNGKEIGRAHV